jgi:hypothetical protein
MARPFYTSLHACAERSRALRGEASGLWKRMWQLAQGQRSNAAQLREIAAYYNE